MDIKKAGEAASHQHWGVAADPVKHYCAAVILAYEEGPVRKGEGAYSGQ